MDHIIISYKSIIVSFSDPTHSTIKLYIYILVTLGASETNKQAKAEKPLGQGRQLAELRVAIPGCHVGQMKVCFVRDSQA